MRLVLIILATLVFIVVQWGPVLYVARRQWLRGDPYSFRQLRVMMPALFAGAAIVVSAAGAGALALYYRIKRRK